MTDRDTAEMRAAFESDYFGDVPDVKGRERSGSGYKYSVVQSAWSIWRAAWTAALASPPVAVQEERDAPAPSREQIQALALRLFELDVEEIEAELMLVFSAPNAAMKGDQP